MPSKDTKILEFDRYKKYDKAPLIIYAGLACLIEKTDGCKKNPVNSSTTKLDKHINSGFSMSAISSFESIEISMMYTEVKIAWKIFVNP